MRMSSHGRTPRHGRATAPLPAAAGLVLFLVALLLLAVGCGDAGPQEAGPQAPGFRGVTLEAEEVSLDTYRGKPLVLAFMASW